MEIPSPSPSPLEPKVRCVFCLPSLQASSSCPHSSRPPSSRRFRPPLPDESPAVNSLSSPKPPLSRQRRGPRPPRRARRRRPARARRARRCYGPPGWTPLGFFPPPFLRLAAVLVPRCRYASSAQNPPCARQAGRPPEPAPESGDLSKHRSVSLTLPGPLRQYSGVESKAGVESWGSRPARCRGAARGQRQ